MRRQGHHIAAVLNVLLSMAGILLLWFTLTVWTGAVSPARFPTPYEFIASLKQIAIQGYGNGRLHQHVMQSVILVTTSFLVASSVGVLLGMMMGASRRIEALVNPVFLTLRPIPPLAWIPLAIILFAGDTRFAFLIFLGAFFPVYTSTLVGVQRVEPLHRKVVAVYGASKMYTLFHVVIPTVLPDILGGMRVAMGAAWLTIVAAELAGGTNEGLGRMMLNYAELLKIPEIIVGMVTIGAIGFVINEALLLCERILFRWRWQVSL